MVRLHRRLARLDVGCVRLHGISVPARADRQGISCRPHIGRAGRFDDHVDALCRRRLRRLDGRPAGPPRAADDLDPVVFGVQLHRRILSDLPVPAGVPHASGHWHGRRVARRRGAGDRELARPLPRSHGIRSARSWALGYLIAAVLYATLFDVIGWRGMLWMGVLPALAVVWIRVYVKEPEVWLENQKKQKEQNAPMKVPVIALFRKGVAWNTMTCCWWPMSAFTVYYSIFGLFATYMTKELHLTAAQVGWPLAFSNGMTFIFSFVWGSLTDSIGRRWAMIIPAVIGACVAPIYLLTTDYFTLAVAFSIQGAFAGAIYGINPSYCQRTLPDRSQSDGRGILLSHGRDRRRLRAAGPDPAGEEPLSSRVRSPARCAV